MSKQMSAAYHKRWKYDVAHGNYRTTSTEPVLRHLATLEGAGWSMRAVAGSAGVSVQVLCHVRGGQRMMRKDIAAKVLAVRPDTLPQAPSHQTSEPFVPRIGTVRRLRALMTMGWSAQAMAEHLDGRAPHWVYNLLNQQGRWVTRSTHDEVARLYRDLCTKPGPSRATANRARRRGFPGPLDWDDIDHDLEPDTGTDARVSYLDEYDDAVVRRLIDEGQRVRRLTPRETQAAITELLARGVSTFEIERTYHLKPERRAAS